MAKKDKETSSFEEKKALEAKQASKEAKQKVKAAEKAAPGAKEKKAKKDGKKSGMRKVRKWLKDFRGEIKKIVWPDFKTVMKNTGIVLVTVLIIGTLVWIVDFILTQSIKGLKTLASGLPAATTSAPANAQTTAEALENMLDHDHEDEDEHAGHDHD